MHHSESDTLKQTSTEPYVIGIIVEPDRLTCKHYLINRVLNYITSEATINHREVRILIGLRNPYEQTLARRLITLRHRYSNIYVELLISDNQFNKFSRWTKGISKCNYSDIISYADGYNVLHTYHPADFFRTLTQYVAQFCNEILYGIYHSWHTKLFHAITRSTSIRCISIFLDL